MSESNLRQAGHYRLNQFKVYDFKRTKSIDLKLLIHTFNISESMSAGAIRGSAVVYDTSDLIKNFPFLCEEYVEITYTDFFDVEHTDKMFIYSITDVKYPKDKSQSVIEYKLNFVSLSRAFSEDFRIQKAYRPNASNSGLISGYVKEVFDEYYVKPLQEYGVEAKAIDIETTAGQTNYVIPRLTPEHTMQFFARRAFNSSSNSTQTFRFFESREKYYFASNDWMATVGVDIVGNSSVIPQVDIGLAQGAGLQEKVVPVFRLNYLPDLSPDRQESLMYELISIDYGTRANTIEDINVGGYKRRTWEIDMLNGAVTSRDYDHAQAFSTANVKLIHTPEFINNRMQKYRERFAFIDYAPVGAPTGPALRPDQNYADLYNIKTTNFYHYNRNKVAIQIYGRNTLFAGDVLDLQIFEHSASNELKLDEERSGYYLIESIDNVFFESIYTQNIVLSRNGIGAQ